MPNKYEHLLNKAAVIQASIDWWEKEMSDMFYKIENASSYSEMVRLQEQLEHLTAKGRFEDEQMKNIEKEIKKHKTAITGKISFVRSRR